MHSNPNQWSRPWTTARNLLTESPRVGTRNFERQESVVSPFAWQSNKAILFYFTQNSVSEIQFSTSAQSTKFLASLLQREYSFEYSMHGLGGFPLHLMGIRIHMLIILSWKLKEISPELLVCVGVSSSVLYPKSSNYLSFPRISALSFLPKENIKLCLCFH